VARDVAHKEVVAGLTQIDRACLRAARINVVTIADEADTRAFFVDATGSDGLAYHAAPYAHDANFPQLARVIHDRYDLVETTGGARLYQRRDPVAP